MKATATKKQLRLKMEQLAKHVDETFGYGSLELQFLEDHDLTPMQIADNFGWKLKVGAMTVSFYGKKYKKLHTELEFGYKPDAKTMKRLVTESKKHEINTIKAKNTP